jgi:hypothetical protein
MRRSLRSVCVQHEDGLAGQLLPDKRRHFHGIVGPDNGHLRETVT